MLRRNVDAVAVMAIVAVYGIVQLAGWAAREGSRLRFHSVESRAASFERKVELLGTRLEAAGERLSQRAEERARHFEEKAKRVEDYLERRFQ